MTHTYDVSQYPVLSNFLTDWDHNVVGIRGPFGCLAGETLVITDKGPLPIARLTGQEQVLSWDEKDQKFQLCEASSAYPKGEDYLYRVVTPQGEFAAAGHHRVLCEDGTYQPVSSLTVGQKVSLYSPVPLWKTFWELPSLCLSGVRHCVHKSVNWIYDYVVSNHQYDLLPLMGLDISPEIAQQLNDAQTLSSRSYGWSFLSHRDGLEGPSLEHIHQGPLVFQTQTDDSFLRGEILKVGDQGCTFGLPSERSGDSIQANQPLHEKSWFHRKAQQFSQYLGSWSSSCAKRCNSYIIRLERDKVKRIFWDITVPGTHNYVTVDGMIHHNSGKSVACVHKIMMAASQMPKGKDGKRRSRWLVVRNSYRELEDTTIRTWKEWVPENVFGIFKSQAKVHEVRFNDVELDVLFRSLDNDDDVRKILSLEITGAWVNEAREIPWVIMKNIQGRLGRYPRKADATQDYWTGIIMDTNSPDDTHWWYKFAEVETPEGFKFYSQPSGISPDAENRFNLPDSYYKRMMQGADEAWVKVHVHNQYGLLLTGRPVYPEYHDTIHTADISPIPNVEIVRGWDFGLTPACVFVQIDPKGRALVLDEITADDMSIDRFSDVVLTHTKTKYSGYKIQDYGDPAGTGRAQTDERSCFDILWNKGIRIEGGKQDITIRVESVKKALNTMVDGQPGFLIHPKCQKLRKGFMGHYSYRKLRVSGSDKYSDKPDKNEYSHIHDALQYVMSMMYGGSLIDPFHTWDEEEMEEEYNDYSDRGRSMMTGY